MHTDPPPAPTLIGKKLDHTLVSKRLFTKLARHAYSIGVDELKNYKQSVLAIDNANTYLCDNFQGTFA